MSNVETQIADIERELLALTGDQPPNPAQITTYRVSRTTAINFEEKSIIFEDGLMRYVQVYTPADMVYLKYEPPYLKVQAVTAGTTYTVVSLGAFHLA